MQQRTLNLGQSLTALRHPGFRWFLLGRVAASLTIYMRSVAEGWLAYVCCDRGFEFQGPQSRTSTL